MSQTQEQKRFTTSEVAGDWHELQIQQRIMRPSILSLLADNGICSVGERYTTATLKHA